MDRKKKRLLSPLLERTQDALKGQRSMQTLENYHSRIYVGCSQNHPYCGEWLPNQVFRRRGLRPIRGAGHSNSLFQRETDSRERCRHGRSRMEVRHRSQAGCWTDTIISTIPIRHEPQYWGRAAVRLHHYGERVNRARLVGAERNIHHLRQ